MSANPLAWAVLVGAVVLALAWKGYIKLPGIGRTVNQQHACGALVADRETGQQSHVRAAMSTAGLATLLAAAVKREVEEEFAAKITESTLKQIREAYAAPLSVPDPAGTQQAGSR